MNITNKGKQWEDDNMVWPSWSYFIFLNGGGLLKAGERSKVSKWGNHGLIYIILWWVLTILGNKMGGIINTIAAYTCLASYILCMIESNAIRTKYLLTLEMVQNGQEKVSDEDVIAALRKRIIDDYNEKVEEQKKKNTDDIDKNEETLDEEPTNNQKEGTNIENNFKDQNEKSYNYFEINKNGINYQSSTIHIFKESKHTYEDNSINYECDEEDDDCTNEHINVDYTETESNCDYNYSDNQSDYDDYNDNGDYEEYSDDSEED